MKLHNLSLINSSKCLSKKTRLGYTLLKTQPKQFYVRGETYEDVNIKGRNLEKSHFGVTSKLQCPAPFRNSNKVI